MGESPISGKCEAGRKVNRRELGRNKLGSRNILVSETRGKALHLARCTSPVGGVTSSDKVRRKNYGDGKHGTTIEDDGEIISGVLRLCLFISMETT